jgi:porin
MLLHSAAQCNAAAATPDAGYLSGDRGGARTHLADRGISLTGHYTSEIAGNARGGDRKLVRYTDQWAFNAKFDLERLLGWNAAKFQILITDRNGRNLVNDAGLGTLQQVQEVYGRGQTWRLTQFWYAQSWLQGMLDLRIGRVSPGQDFASFSCDFQNLTFCGSQPGNVRGEYWFNWPVSQWGARIKFAPDESMYWQLGAYQVNPRYANNGWARDNGLYPNNPSGTTGALIPLEAGWQPKWQGRPGSYKFGAWYDTSNAADAYLDKNRLPLVLTGEQPLEHDSRHGFYINFRQQISGAADQRGATAFINFTRSDRDTGV